MRYLRFKLPEKAARPGVSLKYKIWWVVSLVILGLQLTVAGAYGPLLDVARDVYFANQIATGASFPLGGPPINATFQLGPIWFYLEAIPLMLGGGYSSVVYFAAFLSALKFPLAYYAGYLLQGPRFAWLLLFAVFANGWTWMPARFLTHAACLEAAFWWLLCAFILWHRNPTALRAGIVGFAAAVAFHAHPTAMIFSILACVWVIYHCLKRLDYRAFASIMLGAFVLFSPYFYEQSRDGWIDVAASVQYAKSTFLLPSFSRFCKLLAAVILNGHSYELQYMALMDARHAFSVVVVLAGLYLLLFIFLLRDLVSRAESAAPTNRFASTNARLAAYAFLALCGQCAFLLLIRPITPLWMLFSLLPLASCFLACGLHALLQYRFGIYGVGLIAGGLTVLTMMPLPAYFGREGDTVRLPETEILGLVDVIVRPEGSRVVQRVNFRVRDVDGVSKVLSQFDVAHGQAATAIEGFLGGVEGHFVNRSQLQLGGVESKLPNPNRIAGFNHSVWEHLKRKPSGMTDSMGWIAPKLVLHPTVGERISSPISPRIILTRKKFDPVGKFSLNFIAPCDATIAITNMLPAYVPLSVHSAELNGVSIAPIYKDNLSQFFRAPHCVGLSGVPWKFELEGMKSVVDVIAF